jgi:hypothetical protein
MCIFVFNTFSPTAVKTLKSTVPGHFTTLWKSRNTSTPPGQLARDAAEYYYSARAESVNRTTLQFLLHTLQVHYMCTVCDPININTIMGFVPNCL